MSYQVGMPLSGWRFWYLSPWPETTNSAVAILVGQGAKRLAAKVDCLGGVPMAHRKAELVVLPPSELQKEVAEMKVAGIRGAFVAAVDEEIRTSETARRMADPKS